MEGEREREIFTNGLGWWLEGFIRFYFQMFDIF